MLLAVLLAVLLAMLLAVLLAVLLTCTTDFPTYYLLTHQALILGLYRGVLAGAEKLAAGEELC